MIHDTSPAESQTFSVQYACIYAPPHWYDADQIGLSLAEAIQLAHQTHRSSGRTTRVIEELTGRPTGHYYLGKQAPGTNVLTPAMRPRTAAAGPPLPGRNRRRAG